MLRRLQKALYGLRRAPALFQAHLRSVLISLEFVPSVGEPCLFTHKGMGITLLVHVDDVLLTGTGEAVTTMAARIGELMSLKIVGFIADTSWTKFLGKEIRRVHRHNGKQGWCVRLPETFFASLFEATGLSDAKTCGTPGTNASSTRPEDLEILSEEDHAKFRSIVGKLQWCSNERPDILFSLKQVARKLSEPTRGDLSKAKRIARYLKATQDLVLFLSHRGNSRSQDPDFEVRTWVDASWDTTSTSCGVVTVNGFLLTAYSRAQTCVSLSSCESELYALNSGVTESMLTVSLLQELGRSTSLTVFSDSSAALATVQRRGVGKLRHIALRQLFLQNEVASGRLKVMKVNGDQNVADIGTKFQTPQMLSATRDLIGLLPIGKIFSEPRGAVEHVSEGAARYLDFIMRSHPKTGTKNDGNIYSSRRANHDKTCEKESRTEHTKCRFDPNSRCTVSTLFKDDC